MKVKNIILSVAFVLTSLMLFSGCSESSPKDKAATAKKDTAKKVAAAAKEDTVAAPVVYPPVDKKLYDSLMKKLANGDTTGKWPVKKAPYPLPGAILPFKRVIAYYGNLSAKKMGILGELPPDEMLAKLRGEVKHWEKADPQTPVQPALHYIAVVAAGFPGKDNMYINRMPEKKIDSAVRLAKRAHAILFLDIQVALSNIRAELPKLEKYWRMPNVHCGIDPEFAMHDGIHPGKKIGSYDAAEVNYVSGYLANEVKKYNLPPKIFIVHRFTRKMLTNYQNIKLHPEIQFVMDMDGFGPPDLKTGTYRDYIYHYRLLFTG
jgi:outer membrane murein-binding lipoprotein Lpp